jgi:hypothetical protein
MAVDVTNTQTGSEPEVHNLQEDTKKFERNVSPPPVEGDTIPSAKEPPAVSPGEVKTQLKKASELGLGDEEQGISPEEFAEKQSRYDKPPVQVNSVNKEYWKKIYDYASGDPSFNKDVTLDSFINYARGNEEFVQGLHKELARSSFKRPLGFSLGSDFNQFKKNLFSDISPTSSRDVAAKVIGDQFRPSVSVDRLKHGSILEQKRPAGMAEVISQAHPKTEEQPISGRHKNPLYKDARNKSINLINKRTSDYAALIRNNKIIGDVDTDKKVGKTKYAEEFDPVAAFHFTEEVLHEELSDIRVMRHDLDERQSRIDEYRDMLKNNDFSSYDKKPVFSDMDDLTGKSDEYRKKYVEIQLSKEETGLDDVRQKMLNKSFGVAQEGEDVKLSDRQISINKLWNDMGVDRENDPDLNNVLTSYEEDYRLSKEDPEYNVAENNRNHYVSGLPDENREKYKDYFTLLENKIDLDIKTNQRRKKLAADPNFIMEYEGYHENLDHLKEDMAEDLSTYITKVNESNYSTIKTKLESYQKQLTGSRDKEYDTVLGKINEEYQPQYEEIIDELPEARAITAEYEALYAAAGSDEEREKINIDHNDALMKIPALQSVAEQHQQAVNSVSKALEDKYFKASTNYFDDLIQKTTKDYYSKIKKRIEDKFIVKVNDDIGIRDYVHNEIETNADFNILSYGDKKKAVPQLWTKFRNNILKNTKGMDSKEIALRTGEVAQREFMYHAMNSLYFEGATAQASPFQVKAYAEDLIEEVDAEIKRRTEQRKGVSKGRDIDIQKMAYGDSPLAENFGPVEGSTGKKEDANSALYRIKGLLTQVIEHPEDDPGWFSDFMSGVGSKKFDQYIPFVHDITNMARHTGYYSASKKLADGRPLSFEEKALIESHAAVDKLNELRPRSTSYQVGEGLAMMTPYVGEFIVTLGAFNLGKNTVKNIAVKSIEKRLAAGFAEGGLTGMYEAGVAGEAALTAYNTSIKKTIIDGLSYTTGTLFQATANPLMTANTTFERITPEVAMFMSGNAEDVMAQVASQGEDFGEAFLKAYGTTWAEMFTENLGPHLMKLPKGAVNKITSNTEWLQRGIVGGWYRTNKFVSKSQAIRHLAAKKAGIGGVMEEYSEEFVNGRLSSFITGDRDAWDINKDEELVTFLTVAVAGVGIGGASLVKSKVSGANVELEVDVRNPSGKKQRMTEQFTYKQWRDFNKLIGKKGVNPTLLSTYMGKETLTSKQRDILTAIYTQSKGKEIKNHANYDKIKAEVEESTGVVIPDTWVDDNFRMPGTTNESGFTMEDGTRYIKEEDKTRDDRDPNEYTRIDADGTEHRIGSTEYDNKNRLYNRIQEERGGSKIGQKTNTESSTDQAEVVGEMNDGSVVVEDGSGKSLVDSEELNQLEEKGEVLDNAESLNALANETNESIEKNSTPEVKEPAVEEKLEEVKLTKKEKEIEAERLKVLAEYNTSEEEAIVEKSDKIINSKNTSKKEKDKAKKAKQDAQSIIDIQNNAKEKLNEKFDAQLDKLKEQREKRAEAKAKKAAATEEVTPEEAQESIDTHLAEVAEIKENLEQKAPEVVEPAVEKAAEEKVEPAVEEKPFDASEVQEVVVEPTTGEVIEEAPVEKKKPTSKLPSKVGNTTTVGTHERSYTDEGFGEVSDSTGSRTPFDRKGTKQTRGATESITLEETDGIASNNKPTAMVSVSGAEGVEGSRGRLGAAGIKVETETLEEAKALEPVLKKSFDAWLQKNAEFNKKGEMTTDLEELTPKMHEFGKSFAAKYEAAVEKKKAKAEAKEKVAPKKKAPAKKKAAPVKEKEDVPFPEVKPEAKEEIDPNKKAVLDYTVKENRPTDPKAKQKARKDKQNALNTILGKASNKDQGIINKVAETLGVKPLATLQSMATNYMQNDEKFDAFVDAVNKAKVDIQTEEAEDKKVKEAESKKDVAEEKKKYKSLIAEGDALMKEKDYNGAIKKYQEAEKTYPLKSKIPELANEAKDKIQEANDRKTAIASVEESTKKYKIPTKKRDKDGKVIYREVDKWDYQEYVRQKKARSKAAEKAAETKRKKKEEAAEKKKEKKAPAKKKTGPVAKDRKKPPTKKLPKKKKHQDLTDTLEAMLLIILKRR